jgi:ribosome-binding factor A
VGLRRLKVNEGIKESLSTIITKEGLKDPRVGFVTVTGVETTPDVRAAKVFVSVLGDEQARDATLVALERSSGYLQSRLGDMLRMKRTPKLQFVYDETLDQALHIAKLIKQEEAVLGQEAPEILVGDEELAEGSVAEGEGGEASEDDDA